MTCVPIVVRGILKDQTNMTTCTADQSALVPQIEDFEGHPVRTILLRDNKGSIPFFLIEDVCPAVGWKDFTAQRADSTAFPAYGKREFLISTELGPRLMTALSPIGILEFADGAAPRGTRMSSWAKKKTVELCRPPVPDAPELNLKLTKDGDLPERPTKFSGRLAEWKTLRYSQEYLAASAARKADQAEYWRNEGSGLPTTVPEDAR